MTIEGVIFDLGGTLFEFVGDPDQVYAASRLRLLDSLAELGVDLPRKQAADAVRREVEASHLARAQDHRERQAQDVIRHALTAVAQQTIPEALLSQAVKAMFKVSEAHWHVMDGAVQALEQVQADGLRLAVLSNASDADNVRRLLDTADLTQFFDPIVVSADIGWRKPAAAIFEPLLDAWGRPSQNLAMVGDTLNADIEGAQKLGIHGIWLKSAPDRADNRAARDRIEPSLSIDSLTQLHAALESLSGV
jgi:putative hydrolase of the HAD superfamily